MSRADEAAEGGPLPLGRGPTTPLSHRLAERAITAVAFLAIAAIALIFAFILKEALPLFWETALWPDIGGLDALFLPREWPGYEDAVFVWQPVGAPSKLNVVPLLVGTLKVTTVAMFISVPMGVGSAIFVSQYAPRAAREVLKPCLELLASIPSVVLGFFALIVLATWLQDAFGFTYRLNAVVAALGLSLAVIPMIFTISEDALRAVPRELSEAAMALGARKWQTTLRVVLPAALPGIAAAVILGFGRAIGETMVVLMASGNAAVMELFDPTTSARTVTATIAAELGEVAQGDPHWRVLFLLGVLLFLITFALNRLGAAVIARLHRRLTAGARA
ncbi:MAG: phosphate ABC transporter permease subunit PstC [Sandaracinaceae bacterium]|nr:MAG: phosphate ABC transporter permease subunit PstC [Sandaracinaceae bacterium]